MASPTSLILKDNQLLSFQVGFSSYHQFRKAHSSDNFKSKSWGKGILDLDFDARKCIIRNGEHTLLVQSFTEFQTIVSKEDESDEILTISFNSDEWDIVPQNVAETACIIHLGQYIGKEKIITATEVVRSGLEKGIIGLEQTPIFKQGLVQQHEHGGRKLQVRFLIVLPGKVFGFQKQQEIVGYRATFVTSLVNASVNALTDYPGFQLNADRLEPLYFDALQNTEQHYWIDELSASIELTKDAVNGIFPPTRAPTGAYKAQRKDPNQDAEKQGVHSPGLKNGDQVSFAAAAFTNQNEDFGTASAALEPTQEPLADAEVYHEFGNGETEGKCYGETEGECYARINKPLSRARICLEDSLSELRILMEHIEAASYVLQDLHLFMPSNYEQERRNFASPSMSRSPSSGIERSWRHNNWQHRYLYDSSYQDLMSSYSYRSDPHDTFYGMSNCLRELHDRQKDDSPAAYLETSYEEQPAVALEELGGRVEENKESDYSSEEDISLDTEDSETAQKIAPSLHDAGNTNAERFGKNGAELPTSHYPEIQRNDEPTSSQKPLAAAPMTPKGPTMVIKPSVSLQASARTPRAVAFKAQPDILSFSNDPVSSEMQGHGASIESISRQSSSTEKPYTLSEPRASQTDFPPSNPGDNPTFSTMQNQSSLGKSTSDYVQPRQSRIQQARPNRQDFDGVVLAQDNTEYESMWNTVGSSLNQAPQSADSLVSKARDKSETRKSTPNFNGSSVGESQQGGRRHSYQDTPTFQPEDTRKSLATRQNQKGAPDVSVSRQSQDAISKPETRKSVASSRHIAGDPMQPEARKSMALNKQKPDPISQLDARKSLAANRQSSMPQPSSMSNNAGTGFQPSNNVQPNTYTGELRKSLYQGGNLQAETNVQGLDTSQLDADIYQQHQEGDSDAPTLGSSSSQSSIGLSGIYNEPEAVSRVDPPSINEQNEIFAAPAAASSPAALQLDNRKSRMVPINRSRTMSGQVPLKTTDLSRPLNTTRGASQAYVNPNDRLRGGDSLPGRRRSQS